MDKIIYLAFCFTSFFANAQFKESSTKDLVIEATSSIYNLEFDHADSIIKIIEPTYSNHPGLYLLKALDLTWKNWPLSSENEAFETITKQLQHASDLCDSLLEIDENDPEAIFMALSSHGLLVQYYADDGSYLKSVGSARAAYRFIKEGFELKEEFVDFYFSTGLYNYYVEQYPDSHPIYRPLMWFFKNGDKEKGIEQMEYAAKHAELSSVEAHINLTYVYLRYLDSPLDALRHTSYLVETYPNNLFFRGLHTEALSANNRFEEMVDHSNLLKKSDIHIFKYTGFLFGGEVYEKYQKDHTKAELHYQKFIDNVKSKNKQVEDYISMAYNGLARIYLSKNDKEQAKKYAKLGSKYAYYDRTEKESERILDSI
ncbi:MAG: hypothetical protein AAF363_04695 [Bacteroidota bacterium]